VLTWSCSACTFLNTVGARSCEICGTPHDETAIEAAQARQGKLVTCGVCFEPIARSDAFMSEQAQQCGHFFCVDDMRLYLRSKLDGGTGGLTHLRCPGDRCARLLSDAELDAGFPDARDRMRFRRFRRLQQLAQDPAVVFCSGRGCDVAMFGDPAAASPKLLCPDCHQAVCFSCRVPWHNGQTCAQYQQAQSSLSSSARALAQAEAERAFALFANAQNFRQCARCRCWVERAEGCEKVTCRCGYRFCHKCGSPEARCGCTPLNHVFYDHATVLNNWGRG